MKDQKLRHGDLVTVDRHWVRDDEEAIGIVIGSYSDQYGGDSDHSRSTYTVYVKNHGECSWHDEGTLVLIRNGATDTLVEWRAELDALHAKQSDLDWIFAHGVEVIEQGHGASIQRLFNCVCEGSLWGSRGEGFVWYENAAATMSHAAPFLADGDKAGWLARCEELKAEMAEKNR